MNSISDKQFTPNKLRREVEKLEHLIQTANRKGSQDAFSTSEAQVLVTRIMEQTPLVLDELEWELSSLRAAKKAREMEVEKNKGVLYFLLASFLLGLFSLLVISPFVIGVPLLSKWGVSPWAGFILIIVLIIGIVKSYSALRNKKNKGS